MQHWTLTMPRQIEIPTRTFTTNVLSPVSLLLVIRLPFWFACFWAVVGTVWRPLPASIGLLFVFLILLVGIEWLSQRCRSKIFSPTKKEPKDDTIMQQMTRSQTSEGLDRLEGTFYAEFQTDEMTTTVHIPFCPAFENIPKVQVFPIDESDASLRVISPKTFGIRVDVKRNNPETGRLRFAVIAEG